MAEDPDPLDVDVVVAHRELLDGSLLVGEAVVAQVVVAEVRVRSGPLRRAAPVTDLDHDESELRHLLAAAGRRERAGDALLLRTRVDAYDDRVLLLRIEVERLPHVAVQVGGAVRGLHLERLRDLPAHFVEAGEVGPLEFHDFVALGIAKHRIRYIVHPRGVVDDEPLRRGQGRPVGGITRIEARQAGAVEVHAVEMLVVDVLTLLVPVAAEVEPAVFLVDADDAAGPERPGCDRVLQLAVDVVEVVVAPAAALRPPDELFAVLHVANALELQVAVLRSLREEDLDLASLWVEGAELDVAEEPVSTREAQLVLVLEPVDVLVALVLPLRRDLRHRLHVPVEEVQLGGTNPLVSRHRVCVALQGGSRIRDGIHEEQFLEPA